MIHSLDLPLSAGPALRLCDMGNVSYLPEMTSTGSEQLIPNLTIKNKKRSMITLICA